jgi:predicted PurR-regulated permease PerM
MASNVRQRAECLESSMAGPSTSDLAFVRRVFIVVGIGALVVAVWALSDILLLLFGAILFAVVLHAIAAPLQARLGIGTHLSLALAGGGVLAILAGAGFYFGPELAKELQNVAAALPEAAGRVSGYFKLGTLAEMVRNGSPSTLGGLASRVIAWSTTIAGAMASLLLIVFGGIYLAINPRLYRDGLVMLVPPGMQSNVKATLDDAGVALKLWLKGQLLAMLLVGIFTGFGLWLVGVPSAFGLGFLAGIAEFVPIIGPIVAAIPALLIASSMGWQTALMALAVLVAVQQIESNVITPLIADRLVSIAPAVALFAVVAIGVVFGPLGLILGFPLAIVFDVAVRRLYVHDTLGERVEIVGKSEGH